MAKKASSAEAKYMIGTEGKADYLIVSEKDKFRLGIKGFVNAGPGSTMMLAVRVRCMQDKTATEDFTEYTDAFPIQFTKLDEKRASCEMIQLLNRSQLQVADVLDKKVVENFTSTLADWIEAQGIQLMVDRMVINDHLYKAWFEPFESHLNPADPALVLADWVRIDKLVEALQEGELTVTQNETIVNGKSQPWPDGKAAAKPKATKKAKPKAQGDQGTSDNVVTLPTKKKPSVKPPKK